MEHLAELIRQRNAIDREIASALGRPALPGHFGEFIVAQVFDVDLHPSAVSEGSDGLFASGPHSGKTVEIKYYPKNEGSLDMKTPIQPDFYLVLTGPRSWVESTRGTTRPWVIEAAYLFDGPALARRLTSKIGTATSVWRKFWDEAEIYPRANPDFPLTPAQRGTLALFSEESVGG